jgi:hypothetical protein
MLYKYTLCTSGGLLSSILIYNILLYRDDYIYHKFNDNYYYVCRDIKNNILEKIIGTTIGFFAGVIFTSKLINR